MFPVMEQAAFVAFAESRMLGDALKVPVEVLIRFLICLAAYLSGLRRFEAFAIVRLVCKEIAAIAGVALVLGAAQADAPFVLRRVDALRAGVVEPDSGRLWLQIVCS